MTRAADTDRAARIALRCLDLTSLNDDDTASDVERLCARADGPCGAVAAVCVWPRFAALARARLPAHIAVAAVANFPHGDADERAAVADVLRIADAGAQEVDVVLPWRALRAGDETGAARLLHAVRRAGDGLLLKIILETGELHDAALIDAAARLALDCGADFLKTSTGRTTTGATPQAVRQLLRVIGADAAARAGVGLKVSGGVRTVADAMAYIALAEQALGADALVPARFRIGASSLLDAIESALGAAESQRAGDPRSTTLQP
jgi:deoxyribose-phosphate aldolase